MSARAGRVTVLGAFNADTTYRARRLPAMGETLAGESFALGPGGKGSNQAVAAARLGAEVTLISAVGADPFGAMARALWEAEGVAAAVREERQAATGAALVFVEEGSGENAIVICPGAGLAMDAAAVEAEAARIEDAAVFLTQLELPVGGAARGLAIARGAGVVTILDPAPAGRLPEGLLGLCDWVVPNAGEAATLTGIAVGDRPSAEAAARALVAAGAGSAVVTLGAAGAVCHHAGATAYVPAVTAGPVVDTTGAGDCFAGALAAALARGEEAEAAIRFATAAAALAVTAAGAAAAMPDRAAVEALLGRG
jgi:ribokinase